MVRYYGREGLMPDPPRSEGGHRLFHTEHVKRWMFIRRGHEPGFTIEQVRSLLDLADRGNSTCADVKEKTLRHRDDVNLKIAGLKCLDRALAALTAGCEGDSSRDGAIFDALPDARDRPLVG